MKHRRVNNRASSLLSPGAARQRGVGLIEVLVAVLVMAIGLLGIAMMQTRALTSNNSSMARSTAVIASYSIVESLRADRSNALAGSYNQPMTAADCDAGNDTLANTQLSNWCTDLAQKLGPSSAIAINCAASVCNITITFDDSRVGAGSSSSQQVVTKVAL